MLVEFILVQILRAKKFEAGNQPHRLFEREYRSGQLKHQQALWRERIRIGANLKRGRVSLELIAQVLELLPTFGVRLLSGRQLTRNGCSAALSPRDRRPRP